MFRLILAAAVAMGVSSGSAAAAEWMKLIASADLEGLLVESGVTVLDIRAPADYAKGHIAGALNAPYGSWRGPKENPGLEPTDAALTDRLQSLGIEPDSRVVVTYQGKDSTDFGAAARVYWTLKSAGLTEIAILNGGLNAWTGTGHVLSNEPAAAVRSSAGFALSEDWMISRVGVENILSGARQSTTIDARPLEFWQGKKKHDAAKRAGTLPGSHSLPESSFFTSSKTEIDSADQVLAILKGAGYGDDSKELVSFCNTGHWAATNWFAMSELAGVEGVKLFPESMVGWANSGGALENETK